MNTTKEKTKERVKRYRERQKALQSGTDSVTDEGVTRIEFIKQVLNDDDLVNGIEAASLRFNDREARYEKAYRYNQWRAGKEIASAVPFALVYNREGMEKIYQSLNNFNVADRVSYGCGHRVVRDGGVPFDMVGEYLEATNV